MLNTSSKTKSRVVRGFTFSHRGFRSRRGIYSSNTCVNATNSDFLFRANTTGRPDWSVSC